MYRVFSERYEAATAAALPRRVAAATTSCRPYKTSEGAQRNLRSPASLTVVLTKELASLPTPPKVSTTNGTNVAPSARAIARYLVCLDLSAAAATARGIRTAAARWDGAVGCRTVTSYN